jgi:hypothetical protein
MRQTVKRRPKNYEVTKGGRIHVYPSVEEPEQRRVYGEIAAMLGCAAQNLIALIRGKERLGPLKQEKRSRGKTFFQEKVR